MTRVSLTTYNIDVHSIVRRWNRLIVEALKSQSSGLSYTLPFDVARLTAYISAMREYLAFVTGQPLLDCPETGPTEMTLPSPPEVVEIDNDSIRDVIEIVLIARDEASNSQSSRLPTGLVAFDFDRQMSYIAKVEALLKYVVTSEPLDLPESSPMQPVSGPGNLGV